MNEREIIIERLIQNPDDEASPNMVRLAIEAQDVKKYTPETAKEIDRRDAEFRAAFAAGRDALRAYYMKLSPESIVECFDGWCCHKYR